MKTEKLIAVLESLRDEQGLIREERVVEFAEPSDSPIHDEFDWSNDIAGPKWRLHQATELIHRVHVVVSDTRGEPITVRAFVSLASDRICGGGYRSITEVLSNEELHRELIKTAMAELKNLEKRFKDLKELQPVFKAIKRVSKKIEKESPTVSL